MARVVLQPAGNPAARQNYEETIESPVSLHRIEPHVSSEFLTTLSAHYQDGECWIWGTTPGRQNDSYYEQMSAGDVVLFYKQREFFSAARVTEASAKNRNLAVSLWGWEDEEEEVTWENVYFLTEPRSIELAYHDLWEVAQFGPEDHLWGFTLLPEGASQRVLDEFDLPIEDRKDPVQEGGAEGAEKSLESGQGFASSAKVRQALEDHSMAEAESYFEDRGFSVEDVSANHPYDLQCEQGDLTIHVEVKGTQTDGCQVILTANEVEFARQHTDQMVLFVVKGIKVSKTDSGKVEASGGGREAYMPWDVDEGELSTINYRYEPPKS